MRRFLPAIIIGLVVLLGLVMIIALSGSSSAPPTGSVRSNPDGLPGLLVTHEPWSSNVDRLGERLDQLGLPRLQAEGTVLHIHQHLDLFVHGKAVEVPAQIGIPSPEAFISPIHVHDTTGVIHVESPTQQDFYLGQFFDVWGLKLTGSDLGAYHVDGSNQLTVYVDGKKVTDDPRKIKLVAHQEIVVAFGTKAELPNPIPSSYQFAEGE